MKRGLLNSLSVAILDDCIYALVKRSKSLTLLSVDRNLEVTNEITSIEGSTGFILKVEEGKSVISVDDKLCLVEDDEYEVVLRANKPENVFWHSAEANGKIFIQEYGNAPTSIYVSKDLKKWDKLITNVDIERSSKHFHNLAYDPYRKWLISTLGDGCHTRAAISEDLGASWKPLYQGPWQFVPISVLRDRIVFGMDSGITKGGVGIYHPYSGNWDFIFLRWLSLNVRLTQMCDLMYSDNGFWIASLGTPQAIVTSRDLEKWYLVCIEGYEEFKHHMMMSSGKDFFACSTGNDLYVFEKKELKSFTKSWPVIESYKAYMDRLRGYGFTARARANSILRASRL